MNQPPAPPAVNRLPTDPVAIQSPPPNLPTLNTPAGNTIEDSILALTTARGPEKSICPSEVARALKPGPQQEGWQSLMTPVRQAALRLAEAGRIDILRKGRAVPPEQVRGVIRLRVKAAANGGGQ